MELLLVVSRTGRPPVDLRVDIDAAAPAAELIDALKDTVGATGPVDAYVARTASRLDPARTVSDARLVHGDRLELVPAGRPPQESVRDATAALPAFELTVVGGPSAGARYPLRAGSAYIVGRDDTADIVVGDPQTSRRHVHLGVGSHAVVATDAGSANGTFLDGRRLSAPTEVQPGQVLELGTTQLSIVAVAGAAHGHANVTWVDGRESYSRSPRVARTTTSPVVTVPTAPVQPPRRKIPMATALVPVVMGAVMAYFMGPMMLLFALMGPVVMAASSWEDRRSGRKEYAARRAAYVAEMDQLERTVDATHRALLAERRSAAPSVAELVEWVRSRDPRLWERRYDEADFLTVRIAAADLPSRLSVTTNVSDTTKGLTAPETADQERAKALAASHALDPAVPVDVGLTTTGVLGIAGSARVRTALVSWLVVQAAILHSPRDLAIVGLLPATESSPQSEWAWLRWLPHTETLLVGVPGARTVASEAEDVRALFQVVDDLVTTRRLRAERGVGDERPYPWVLVVVPGPTAVPQPALSRLLADGPRFGVSCIVADTVAERLPGECRAIVRVDDRGDAGSVTLTASGDQISNLVIDGLSPDLAREVARRLAPLSDATAATATGEVPRRVLLLDLLEMPEPEARQIQRRWATYAGTGTLGAPIGTGSAGPVSIDLRRDGPHGLAAGTTGSGKSELLQSLIGSLAATYPASTLTFVLVDYKGGAAFADCVQLPHTVGFFTDLDAHLAKRALISLNAELRRRERILRENGCKDLPELEQRRPDVGLANLFIVFDEFAFLKKEVPEFVAGVVDIAQRGRSLGVHLMLATQRPSGVVDENIRANTNLRIALRMADEQDSNDVLDRPDAARLPKSLPGRAFVRVGHSDVTLVQSAYANARSQQGGSTRQPTTVEPFLVASGLRDATRGGGHRDVQDDRPTDLQRLVAAIREAHTVSGVADQPKPWLDPLPPLIDLTALLALPAPSDASTTAIPIGHVDLPERQAQDVCWYDPGVTGHLLVYGTSGTGKTQLLRSIAAALSARCGPDDVHLYGLDATGHGLGPLTALPIVGGVVSIDEPERIDRLFGLLEQIVAERAALLATANAGSLAEYRAGGGALPYVVVLLDGLGAFRQTYMNIDRGELLERFERLVGQGRATGLAFVITADRRSAVPTTLSSGISERIVLRMADGDEYASLGLPTALASSTLPPGRGFLNGVEVHVAVLGEDASGAGQAKRLAELGTASAARLQGATPCRPQGVYPLPDRIDRTTVAFGAVQRASVPLGVSGDTYSPVALDLDESPVFGVFGTDRCGRSMTLLTLARGLVESTPGLEAYLVAPRRTPLLAAPWWREVGSGADAADDLARRLEDRLRDHESNPCPWLVVVDDGEELADTPGGNALATLLRRARDVDLTVLAAVQTHTAHRAFGGWITGLRKVRNGIILNPNVDTDGDLYGVRLPKKASRRFPPGRGYLVSRGPVDYVQVVWPD